MSRLTIDITGACNLDCEFCYNDDKTGILGAGEIDDIIIANPDAPVVDIGGGEPLLHKDIVQIIQSISRQNKRANISTNLTIIPGGLLGLEESVRKNTSMQVSINAATKETYNAVAKRDLFEQVVGNIKQVQQLYNTTLSAVIYRNNFSEVDGLLALAETINLPLKISLALPVGNARNIKLITPEEANVLRGKLLLGKISHNVKVYGPLVHEISCPIISATYQMGEATNACNVGKAYYNQHGEKSFCEFVKIETKN